MTLIGVAVVIATILLVVDCLFLILLVLVQLPKKEAGMGQAFGGAATDALFGAGSGNALTKMTKYATGIFFVLVLSLSLLHAQQQRARHGQLPRMLESAKEPAPLAPKPIVTPNTNLTATNFAIPAPATNAVPATNTPAPAPAAADKAQ
jgi:preprotein translocase subunit SecG